MACTGKHLLSKNQLMAWCKSVVGGYSNINLDGTLQRYQWRYNIKNTNKYYSFQDGLIFCALIHKFDPSLLDYDSLGPV